MNTKENIDRTGSEKISQQMRILAFSSGRGGVGTSTIALNTAIFLAQIGKSVVLVDADIIAPCLHVMLGLERPEISILQVMDESDTDIEDTLIETEISGLKLLAGSSHLQLSKEVKTKELEEFFKKLNNLKADYIVLDLPPGINRINLFFLGKVDFPVLVTQSTPEAVEMTYRLITGVFINKLKIVRPDIEDSMDLNTGNVLENARRNSPACQFPPIRNIIKNLGVMDSLAYESVLKIVSSFYPGIVVNKTRIKSDLNIGSAMVSASLRWMGLRISHLGNVEWDDNALVSLCRRIPLFIDFPQSRACKGFESIIRAILNRKTSAAKKSFTFPVPTEKQNLYQLLEIYPGASEEEVRRGLKRIRGFFDHNAIGLSGLCNKRKLEGYQMLTEEAHSTLLDKSKRREYDRNTFPDGFSYQLDNQIPGHVMSMEKVKSSHESLPRVEILSDEMVTGTFLGKVRKSRNVELIDISNRTKISVAYLRAIEEEKYNELPEPVFFKGFVAEFARYLKIDSLRAVKDFFAGYEASKK